MTISYPRYTPSGLENDWFLSGKSRGHSRLDFVEIEYPIWRIDWPIGSTSKELALKNN